MGANLSLIGSIRCAIKLRKHAFGFVYVKYDCESIGEGMTELRVHVGTGYRVYFGRHGKSVVILLCGGDKRSQATDIKQAKAL